jgi:hypothetical protein
LFGFSIPVGEIYHHYIPGYRGKGLDIWHGSGAGTSLFPTDVGDGGLHPPTVVRRVRSILNAPLCLTFTGYRLKGDVFNPLPQSGSYIFDKFYRSSSSANIPGAGLGLSIV